MLLEILRLKYLMAQREVKENYFQCFSFASAVVGISHQYFSSF